MRGRMRADEQVSGEQVGHLKGGAGPGPGSTNATPKREGWRKSVTKKDRHQVYITEVVRTCQYLFIPYPSSIIQGPARAGPLTGR